ncbi:hypothetical protein TNCV_858991 [Trichonephila clavipes]|nr:hypothetical protein TNCV_858991 [Trichonephila clavipes]
MLQRNVTEQVIYCRSQSPDDATTVKLVTNKSRVAPVKSVTMPRLELFIANCRGEERRGPLDVQEKPSGGHLNQDCATTGVQKGYKEFERK